MGDGTLLRDLLAARYGFDHVDVERFSPDHPTYLVRSGSGLCVARVGPGLDRQVARLLALEAAEHPAPRVIPTTDGEPFVPRILGSGLCDVLVMSYVEGSTPAMTPVDLTSLGGALGHLHDHGSAITRAWSAVAPPLPVIDRAVMLPANELAFALRHLLPLEHRLPNHDTAQQWEILVDACTEGQSVPPDLTQAFLHGDAHPWNSVLMPSGQVQFIDWDSAGPGPAVIDAAFLVVSIATGGLVHPVTRAEPRAVDALLAGYREQMNLTSRDGDHLERAMAFRILVCAAVGFGQFLTAGKDPLLEPSIHWSLQRLRAVPRLADTVRRALDL